MRVVEQNDLFFVLRDTTSGAQGYSSFCAQEIPLEVLRGLYGVQYIKPRLVSCKVSLQLMENKMGWKSRREQR